MVLGQPVGREDKWKSRVSGRREPIFLAGKPIHDRICVARVERVAYRRLERFVVGRHRPVLQTCRNMKPAESVFVQEKRRVAGDRVQTLLVAFRFETRALFQRKIGNVVSGPFFLRLIPPDQFLAFAPRFAIWTRARPIIDDAAIARPGEAPAVSKIVLGFA